MKLMEIKELIKNNGEPLLIQFTEKIEDFCLECIPDPLMKGKLVSISQDKECEFNTYKLTFNLSGFEDFNKSVATTGYYNENNEPIDTWFTSGLYPKNGICNFYYDDDEKDIEIFNIINEKTDYEKMVNLFKDLGIGFTEGFDNFMPYKTIFIHQSDITFCFNTDNKYVTFYISY